MNTNTTFPNEEDQRKPLFKPVDWVPVEKRHGPYSLLSDARDVADGVALVLEMLNRHQINESLGDTPLFGAGDQNILTRMAAASLNCVRARIDEHFDDMNDREYRTRTEYEYPRTAYAEKGST